MVLLFQIGQRTERYIYVIRNEKKCNKISFYRLIIYHISKKNLLKGNGHLLVYKKIESSIIDNELIYVG